MRFDLMRFDLLGLVLVLNRIRLKKRLIKAIK